MYAVVDIKGFQFKLEEGETLRVPKFDVETGGRITFSNVLLVSDGEKVTVGTPFVENAVVEAKVTTHDRGDKIIVFKKKRRKDYSVKKGHRQDYTEIVIDSIKIGDRELAVTSSEPVPATEDSPVTPEAAPAGEKKTGSKKKSESSGDAVKMESEE